MTLLAGLLILLRSATKITHKAQSVTCLAAKWHVCATVDSFDVADGESTASAQIAYARQFTMGARQESDCDEAGDEEDDLDNNKLIPSYAYSTISFQKRQALGKS